MDICGPTYSLTFKQVCYKNFLGSLSFCPFLKKNKKNFFSVLSSILGDLEEKFYFGGKTFRLHWCINKEVEDISNMVKFSESDNVIKYI